MTASLRLFFVSGLLWVVGCAQQPVQPLYLWDAFARQQYDMLLGNTTAADEQIRVLQAQIDKSLASGQALPPGFRAHLGMLQLSVGNTAEARTLWEAEKKVFPESTVYMEQLLKRLLPATSKAAPT